MKKLEIVTYPYKVLLNIKTGDKFFTSNDGSHWADHHVLTTTKTIEEAQVFIYGRSFTK